MIMTQKIDLKNLDKSTWETFRFEDIAQKISETIKPEEAKVDIYVGLEHIDGEDIHIRRKGEPSDVKGGNYDVILAMLFLAKDVLTNEKQPL